MRILSVPLVLGALMSVGACGGGDEDAPPATAASTACTADMRKDVYVAGLTKPAGALSVKVMSASPAPPSTGVNAMTLEVLDGAGAPVVGASITVTPFMPDHGHGSSVKPSVAAAGPGMYTVSNVYFVMAGLWRVTVSVQRAPGDVQEAAFQFCLDG